MVSHACQLITSQLIGFRAPPTGAKRHRIHVDDEGLVETWRNHGATQKVRHVKILEWFILVSRSSWFVPVTNLVHWDENLQIGRGATYKPRFGYTMITQASDSPHQQQGWRLNALDASSMKHGLIRPASECSSSCSW